MNEAAVMRPGPRRCRARAGIGGSGRHGSGVGRPAAGLRGERACRSFAATCGPRSFLRSAARRPPRRAAVGAARRLRRCAGSTGCRSPTSRRRCPAALIAAEDKRFYEHDGVDWPGLAGAAWDSVWRTSTGRRPRGGSTLTMQLAGLLDPALRPAARRRRAWRRNGTRRRRRWRWSARGPRRRSSRPTSTCRRSAASGGRGRARLFRQGARRPRRREAAMLVALLRGPGPPARVATRLRLSRPAPERCRRRRPLRRDPARASFAFSGPAPRCGARALPRAASSARRAIGRAPAAAPAARGEPRRHHARRRCSDAIGACATIWPTCAQASRTARSSCSTTRPATCSPMSASGELSAARRGRRRRRAAAGGLDAQAFPLRAGARPQLLTAASLVDDSPSRSRPEPAPTRRRTTTATSTASCSAARSRALNVPAVRTLELAGSTASTRLRALGFDTLTHPTTTTARAGAGRRRRPLLALTNAYRALANGGGWQPEAALAGEPVARRPPPAPARRVRRRPPRASS